MKLSNWRTLDKSDYDLKYSDLLEKLSTPLNSSMNEIYDALDNNLDFTNNINATLTSFSVSVDANGYPKSKVRFKLKDSQTSFSGIAVLDVVGASDTAKLPSGGVFVKGNLNEGGVNVTLVKGIDKDNTYNITVLVI